MGHTEAPAAPLLVSEEGYDHMATKTQQPTVLAGRRARRQHNKIHQQGQAPPKPWHNLTEKAINASLPTMACRAVGVEPRTGLGQQVCPAITRTAVEPLGPPSRGRLDGDVCRHLDDLHGNTAELGDRIRNRTPHRSIRLIGRGDPEQVEESIDRHLGIRI
jgi:hypothetical protein